MKLSPRYTLSAVCLWLACGPGPFSLFGQERSGDAPIKVRTTVVSVPVIVSDRQDRYIAGLKRTDFKLFEDGVEQPISFFEATEEPLNVALLLDTSRSTLQVLDDIKNAAKEFIRELRAQDRAMIVSFDYAVHTLSSLTSDRKTLERAIKNAEVGEYVGTALRDAVAEVIGRQFKGVSGRKAIVVLTDGKDAGSRIPEEKLLEDAAESGAMIYTVYYETGFGGRFQGRGPLRRRGNTLPFPFPPQRRDRETRRRERGELRNDEAIRFLTTLAEVSAGRFYASDVTDLKKTFKLIAGELRYQYQLGFYPDTSKLDGRVHALKVEVMRPNVAVRARRSYTAARADQ